MTTFIKPVWVRGFVQELPGKILFISISNVSASFSVSVWMATPPSGWATQYQMVICWLENSLIYFFICVEILGLKVCGMLSINQIFRLEWKSAGRLLVSDNCFVLNSSGFSVWLMLVPCGNGWFVFWFVDYTDIWFDDEWIWFDWLVVGKYEIWFSVWDWQDTDLGCFMNCKITNLYQMFLLRGWCTWDTWKMVQL